MPKDIRVRASKDQVAIRICYYCGTKSEIVVLILFYFRDSKYLPWHEWGTATITKLVNLIGQSLLISFPTNTESNLPSVKSRSPPVESLGCATYPDTFKRLPEWFTTASSVDARSDPCALKANLKTTDGRRPNS